MSRLTKAAGYTMAFLMVPLALATFLGMTFWSTKLVAVTGLHVTPWFTGGEVFRKVNHGLYETRIHRPVFEGLLWNRRQGFVQVDWAGTQRLPSGIEEEIDYDGDGNPDFKIAFSTSDKAAILTVLNPDVLSLEGTYNLKDGRAVRVRLSNRR